MFGKLCCYIGQFGKCFNFQLYYNEKLTLNNFNIVYANYKGTVILSEALCMNNFQLLQK